MLTNTLNNIKTKDIFTYKGKGCMYTLCQSSVLWGAQKLFLSADHHLVRSILMLWEDPPVRKARKGPRNARPQLVIKGLQQQLADAMSTPSLTGLRWADGSKAIYDMAKAVVGTERIKARSFVIFAALKDAWWNDCASRLQRAAESGDTKVVHQLLWEVCGPTQRKAIALPMLGGGTSKMTKETAEAFKVHFGMVLN